ncbi:pirin family protein [Caballeronia glathei]|nr:pirin family protein [Caballeronia glathei]
MRSPQPSRPISFRTTGRTNGQLTRLAGPSDVGRSSKPFVILDRFVFGAQVPINLPVLPHSGVAVLTYLHQGSIRTSDSQGVERTLTPGAVGWLRSGRGAWDVGPAITSGGVVGYRLSIALPPILELSEPYQSIVKPMEVPVKGPARILLGQYDGAQSSLQISTETTCLHVTLKAGNHWRYDPPDNHDIMWVAVHSGSLVAGEPLEAGDFVTFDRSDLAVDFFAKDDCEFMLGSAQRSPFDVVEGYFSVHTNAAALRFGEVEIGRLVTQLINEKRIDSKQAKEVFERLRFVTSRDNRR